MCLGIMLSPTSQRPSQRTLTTSAVVVVTIIIILLTLYNLGDTRVVSGGSPVQLSGDEKDTARISTFDAAKSTTLSNTPGTKQDVVKIPTGSPSLSAKAATSAIHLAISSAPAAPNEPRRAFVTFLEADTGTNHGDEAQGTDPDNEDIYFVGMLHPPRELISPNY